MDEDELDPRIQVELEKLNSATDVINKLEIELDEANTTFRMLLNECTRRLKVHSSKHGSAIESARPYYEALDIARHAQQECQQAAVSFQRANEVHEAAKETVALAESRFMSQQPEWRFDSAWQEMLNHATIKVRDAEKQRAESSTYHSQATAKYKDAQEKVHLLEQRLRRNVGKSRPYFEEKQRCNEQLAAQKEAVEMLAAKVSRVKSEYAESLRRLEGISEEIHRKRGNMQIGGCGVREPGVGAELEYKGELDHCDISREKAFDKMAYIYDAKFNTNSMPDVGFDTQAAGKNNSAIQNTKDCDDVSHGTLADGNMWVEVDFRQSAGNFQLCADAMKTNPGICDKVKTTPRRDSDPRCDIPRESLPDNHKTSGIDNKLSFDCLHAVHFNPVKEFRRERTGDGDSGMLSEEWVTSTNLCKDVLPEVVCPAGTATYVSSNILQGKNSLQENEDNGKISSDVVQEDKVDSTITSENSEGLIEEDAILTCDSIQSRTISIGSSADAENGATDINSVIPEDVGNDVTKSADYCDFQSLVDANLTFEQLQVETFQTNSNILRENEGAKNRDLEKRRTLPIVDVDDVCSQGDAGITGSCVPANTSKLVADNLWQKQSASEVESEDSLIADPKTKSTLESSGAILSRPDDLELTFKCGNTQLQQDRDGNAALELFANTQREETCNEINLQHGDVSSPGN